MNNEILAHSNIYPNDWIELHNTTAGAINIGGWFLSDKESNLTKYEIPDGTMIGANGYIVFTQDDHFGSQFALSENGEIVYLSSGQGGEITGYRQVEDFGASAPDVAFGRYYKASTDTYNFVAMSENTPGPSYEGAANAYPEVGPIVINEIMYNPQSGDQDAEYIELHNIGASSVGLMTFDINEGIFVSWKLAEAIDFTFPFGTMIPAGGYLIVAKDPATFITTYGAMPSGVNVLGPYDGKLSNGGEKLELSKPGDMVGSTRYYIRIDRVNYSDGSHPEDFPNIGVDPWPTEPDGGGASLERITADNYGNDPSNWQSANPPTPGE